MDHTGGTYSLSALMDYPKLRNFLTLWNFFQSLYKNSESSDHYLQLLTSRWIVERVDFYVIDVMIVSALKELLNTHNLLPKEE